MPLAEDEPLPQPIPRPEAAEWVGGEGEEREAAKEGGVTEDEMKRHQGSF